MSYYAREFGVNASAFFGATIESRQGYQFFEPSRLIEQSYTHTYENGDYWKYCRMLGITTTPRLCCVYYAGNYEIATVYKESDNYIVKITEGPRIVFTEGSTDDTRIKKLMI